MSAGRNILSVIVGAAMLSLPAGALAGYYDSGASARHYTNHERADFDHHWRGGAAPFQLADDDDGYHHDHNRDHGPNWRRRHRQFDENDYNWGGRNRYDHPYSYYHNPAPPPEWGGWNRNQRTSYLTQRRDAAVRLQRRMRAKGDNGAADRLGAAIQELNRRIARGG